MHVSAGQEAFELHSKDTVNDATYLLLSSLSVEALRKANIIKALAMNLHLARPDKDPGSFVSTKSACLCIFLLGNSLQLLVSNAHHLSAGCGIYCWVSSSKDPACLTPCLHIFESRCKSALLLPCLHQAGSTVHKL